MYRVLVHCPSIAQTCSARRLRAPSPSFSSNTLALFLLSFISLLSFPSAAFGQAFANNGQFFTKGLTISDAPAPGSPQHAGSDIVIAFDLSGDGKIPQNAFIPGSGASTGYDSLEIYLVSSQLGVNYTVSNSTDFLQQEPGSTVKHLNWPIPNCISPGSYNLTYYENSHINNEPFFSITPINVTMDNANKNTDASACDRISNELQPQPQLDSAPSVNPYLDPSTGLALSGISSSGTIYTITVGTSGLPSQWTIEPGGSTITDTTEAMTTATIVIVSSETLTETVTTGNPSTITTTSILTSTVTAIMAPSAVTAGGFLPVNSSESLSTSRCTVFAWLFVLLLHTIFGL